METFTLTYKEALTVCMDRHAKDGRSCFVGYGLRSGRAMGTLKNVPEHMLCEMPTAENLMMGAAIGMSLKGRLPLVYFERADFLLNATDAIVNHLAQIETISNGEFRPAVIIRVTVGNKAKPLFTGATHVQDFTRAFSVLCKFMFVARAYSAEDIEDFYGLARERQFTGQSSIIFEMKDLV